ncbi:MAG: hypothetical protein HY559_06960 [Gammaproteobacteria bacterium]|nr:hypothetical protein [Gammaproteobacteria bacterium]
MHRNGIQKGFFYTLLWMANAFMQTVEADRVPDRLKDSIAPWHISGSTHARAEYYSNRGNTSASIYPFEHTQWFYEFSLNADRVLSPADRMTSQIVGAISDSKYRSSTETGLILERLNFNRQKGDARIPYHLELGDHAAFFSLRTIQRTLKGGLLELQPRWNKEHQMHSLVFLTGAGAQTWTHFDPWDDYYTGASWLVDDKRYGRYNLNLVHNLREKNSRPSSGLHDRRQLTTSLAGEKELSWKSEKLILEGELAFLDGDIGNNTKNREDSSLYLQLSGRRQSPLTYRLRYEQTGKDFNPQADVIPTNRRSYEIHMGYQLIPGLYLRGRLQRFYDNFEKSTTANRTNTDLLGVNLSGPFSPFLPMFGKNLSGRLDVFVNETDKSSDKTILNTRLDLSKPLPYGWSGSLGYFANYVNDKNPSNIDSRIKELRLQGSHTLLVKDWTGTVTPGVTYRAKTGGTSHDKEISPTLSATLARRAHSVAFYSVMDDFDRRSAINLNQKRLSMAYRYTKNPHTFGAEFEQYHRDPFQGTTTAANQNTNAKKFALFWMYNFDRPARRSGALAQKNIAPSKPMIEPRAFDFADLAPGTLTEKLEKTLNQQWGQPIQLGNIQIFEAPLLESITARQRLVLSEVAGILQKSVHIIELEETGDESTLQQTFESIRTILLGRYGKTVQTFEAVTNEQPVARPTMEWEMPNGKIRFGIPKRLDGKVRIEIQYARHFPALQDPNWGFEGVS